MEFQVTESKNPKGWLVTGRGENSMTVRYILKIDGKFEMINPFNLRDGTRSDTLDQAVEEAKRSIGE